MASTEQLQEELSGLVLEPSAADDGMFTMEGDDAENFDPDDMTCAICLERTQLVDIALVKGCEHQYCVNCILQWSLVKEHCPQCKKPFDYLLTHKQLDGSLTDYLAEESVVLLKRAVWFQDHMRDSEKGRATMALLSSARSSSGGGAAAAAAAAATAALAAGDDGEARDWADLYEDYLDAELEEDEEIESYYFSSAAGRARVVLGNRRWGEGGYMRAGRMFARPVVQQGARTPSTTTAKAAAPAKQAASKAGGGSSSSGKAAGASNGASSSRGASSSNGSCSSGGSATTTAVAAAAAGPEGGDMDGGCSGSGGGGSSSRGRSRSMAVRQPAQASPLPPWLVDDDPDDDYDDDDFTIHETSNYSRSAGGSSRRGASSAGGGGSTSANGDGGSGSRSRSRGMIKPQRKVPKGAAVSPALATAACPVVGPSCTPLGRSPGSGGGSFHVGSWGGGAAAGRSPNSCGGMWAMAAAAGVGTPGTAGSSSSAAAAAAAGSTPGSGRRARRNARRAAADVDTECEWD